MNIKIAHNCMAKSKYITHVIVNLCSDGPDDRWIVGVGLQGKETPVEMVHKTKKRAYEVFDDICNKLDSLGEK